MLHETLNISIIDDNSDDLELAKYHLKKRFENAQFTLAENKDEFWKKYDWVKPDLIVCDYNLRECTGQDILIELRKISNTPFLFFTGNVSNEEEVANAVLKGASGYLLKSNIHKLSDVAETIIKTHKKNQVLIGSIEDLKILVSNHLSECIHLVENNSEHTVILSKLNSLKSLLSETKV